MTYIILVAICILVFIDYFLWTITIGGGRTLFSMWETRLSSLYYSFLFNHKYSINLTSYQSHFTENQLFYNVKKDEVYSEDFLSLELYFKDKIISLTYFYEPYYDVQNNTNCAIINSINLNQLHLQNNYGTQMNHYLKMLPYFKEIKNNSKNIEENVSFLITKLLEQETSLAFQEQFSIHKIKLIQQLQNEISK